MGRTAARLGLALAAALALLGASGASPAGCEGPPARIAAPPVGGAGIVNGVPTGYETWRGVVALMWSGSGFICTGTLVDPEVVLSAGHCVLLADAGIDFVANPGEVWIFGGANVIEIPELIAYVDQVVVHPTWNGTDWGTDLSMLKLSAPVDAVEWYPVRVAPQIVVGEAVQIVGYGLTSTDDYESGGVHRAGESAVLEVTDAEIEIGGAANGCYGDSGGPMFGWQGGAWALTGVTSHGESDECLAESGGWYVNALAYRDWMDETMWDLVGHGLGEPDADTDADTDTDTETGADTDADADTDTDTDADTDTEEPDAGGPLVPTGGCGCGAAGARPVRPPDAPLLRSLI